MEEKAIIKAMEKLAGLRGQPGGLGEGAGTGLEKVNTREGNGGGSGT